MVKLPPYSRPSWAQCQIATLSMNTSALESLGYQVLSLERGIYVLHNRVEPEEARLIGLMLVSFPLAPEQISAKLFLQPVPDGVAASDIVALWHELDARRFEESGLDAVDVLLGPIQADAVSQSSFARQGCGSRFVAMLPSGDVVCFN